MIGALVSKWVKTTGDINEMPRKCFFLCGPFLGRSFPLSMSSPKYLHISRTVLSSNIDFGVDNRIIFGVDMIKYLKVSLCC